MAIIVSLMFENVLGQTYDATFTEPTSFDMYAHGWPLIYLTRTRGDFVPGDGCVPHSRWLSANAVDDLWIRFDTGWPELPWFAPWNLAIDVALILFLATATALSVELWFRRPLGWKRFTLVSIMKATLFTALMLTAATAVPHRALRPWAQLGDWESMLGAPAMWAGDSAWEYVPFAIIFLSLACAMNIVWIAIATASHFGWRLLFQYRMRTLLIVTTIVAVGLD